MKEESGYSLISMEEGGGRTNGGIKKRGEKGLLRERLSKIVSIYIPNDDGAEKVLLKFNEDTEMADLGGQSHQQERRSTALLQSVEDGLSYEVEMLCTLRAAVGRDTGRVRCACVAGEGRLMLSFEGESQILRVVLGGTGGAFCESVWMPKVQGRSLVPEEMRVGAAGDCVYVSGTVAMGDDGETPNWLIVKYDLEERVLACTKRYPHPRFGRFDVDRDGSLLLISPQLEAGCALSQISKLTGSFEARRYHISLGDGQAVYQPLHVAAHGPGGLAWVTATKGSGDDLEHRLMCFRCCVGSSTGGESLRAALEPRRWRLAGHRLGALAALGAHAIAIDSRQQTLCVLSWDPARGLPLVRTVSAPGAPTLVHLCSDGVREAFLFTDHSIFLFKLHEQLIKDSEVLV